MRIFDRFKKFSKKTMNDTEIMDDFLTVMNSPDNSPIKNPPKIETTLNLHLILYLFKNLFTKYFYIFMVLSNTIA